MKTIQQLLIKLWNQASYSSDISRTDIITTEGAVEMLLDLSKPMIMNDLSYVKPVNTSHFDYKLKNEMFMKSFTVERDGYNFIFEYKGEKYTNNIVCFKPNK